MDKISFIIREYHGTEVFAVKDNKLIKEPIKNENGLSEGMQASAWGIIFTVKTGEDGKLYLESDHTIGSLSFNEDDRQCYVCDGLINKRGLKKLEIKT